MPIYTYRCRKCGEKFDLLVGVTSDKTEKKCSKCGSVEVEKILSAFSVGSRSDRGESCSTGTCSTGVCPTCY